MRNGSRGLIDRLARKNERQPDWRAGRPSIFDEKTANPQKTAIIWIKVTTKSLLQTILRCTQHQIIKTDWIPRRITFRPWQNFLKTTLQQRLRKVAFLLHKQSRQGI